MLTLFPVEPVYPPGFQYHTDFLSREEEILLVDVIKKIDLHNLSFKGYTANRRIASFGYDYSFDDGRLTKGKDIPAELMWLVDRSANKLAIPRKEIGELLITEYPPGSVINWHRDAPPFNIIVGISLLSNCIFKLRPQDPKQQTKKAVISIPVERRSFYVMDGAVRTDWQHSIAPVKTTRYSITLRTLRS